MRLAAATLAGAAALAAVVALAPRDPSRAQAARTCPPWMTLECAAR